jgi:hypothetical protein
MFASSVGDIEALVVKETPPQVPNLPSVARDSTAKSVRESIAESNNGVDDASSEATSRLSIASSRPSVAKRASRANEVTPAQLDSQMPPFMDRRNSDFEFESKAERQGMCTKVSKDDDVDDDIHDYDDVDDVDVDVDVDDVCIAYQWRNFDKLADILTPVHRSYDDDEQYVYMYMYMYM